MSLKLSLVLSSSHGDPKFCNRGWRWLPVSPSLTSLVLAVLPSKSTTEESFDSKCSSIFQFEIWLILPYRSVGSESLSGYLRRTFAKIYIIASKISHSSFASPPLCRMMSASTPINSSSPYICGSLTTISQTEVSLGFCVMGLPSYPGPISLSWPTSKVCSPDPLTTWSRSVLNFLSNPLLLMLQFNGWNGRGLHAFHKSTSLQWLCVARLQNLLSSSPMATPDEPISLKNFSPMFSISIRWWCDFRHQFALSDP
ncbi:unnamed protein product [Arabidopsis halleri]